MPRVEFTHALLLFAFANEVIRVLRVRCPSLIYQQILRVDVFKDPDTGIFYLNEIEGNIIYTDSYFRLFDALYLTVVLFPFIYKGITRKWSEWTQRWPNWQN